jgi:hypothetical protein
LVSSEPPPNEDFESRLKLIGRGIKRVEAEKAPDSKDLLETVRIEAARAQAALMNEYLLIDLRKKYGRNIIRFLWVYFGFAVICLAVSAAHPYGIALSEGVLIAIVGGTAVSVIGVVGTVAAGLFRPPQG